MKYLSLLMVVILAGCNTVPKVNQLNAAPVKPTPRAQPVEAMVPCVKLKPLDGYGFDAVVRKLSEVIGLYEECASKSEQKTEWIKADPAYKK